MQRPGLVRQDEQGADLIRAGAQLQPGRHHHEAGGVLAVVVDGMGQDGEAVQLRRPGGADGGFRQVPAAGHHLGRPGGVRLGDLLPVRVGVEVALALEQALFVGVDVGDGVQRCAGQGHETVLHPDGGLPYHVALVLGEQVVNLPDGPGRAVFNGQHGVVRPAFPQGRSKPGEWACCIFA